MVNSSTVSIIPLYHEHSLRETTPSPGITMTEMTTGPSIQGNEAAPSVASSILGDPPTGYPKFAELMNDIPEMAIFRRFGALNALNLLYLQARLVHIERKLKKAQELDHQSPEGCKSLYAKDWYFLNESEQDGDESQLQLVEEAREKLNEYSKHLPV